MRHKARMVSLFAIIAVVGVAACSVVCGEVLIAENGQARAAIVHNGHEKQARDLQEYLKKITGAELPLAAAVTDDLNGKPLIVLEKVDKVPGAGDRTTARQAYHIKTDGNVLRLTGGSDLGVEYAVWGLLEDHLGCRFYTFIAKGLGYGEPGHEVVPKKATLVLDSIYDLQ